MKNLLSPAVNRSDLRRLNYNKNNFRPGLRTPLRELTTLSQTPGSDEEGILPPHSPPLSPHGQRAPRSPCELVPSPFRPKLRPCMFILNFVNCEITTCYSDNKQSLILILKSYLILNPSRHRLPPLPSDCLYGHRIIIIISHLYSAYYRKKNIGATVKIKNKKITIKSNNWAKIEKA